MLKFGTKRFSTCASFQREKLNNSWIAIDQKKIDPKPVYQSKLEINKKLFIFIFVFIVFLLIKISFGECSNTFVSHCKYFSLFHHFHFYPKPSYSLPFTLLPTSSFAFLLLSSFFSFLNLPNKQDRIVVPPRRTFSSSCDM